MTVADAPHDVPTPPYKGLASYTENDAAIFFGRDRERDIITANLKARRLTVVYGDSGVGKSSLLRAGVASHLLKIARQNFEDLGTPEFIPVVFSSWRDDPLTGLEQAIDTSVGCFAGDSWPPSALGHLGEAIDAAAAATDAYLLIILDQFEEYFLYHPCEQGAESFDVQLARAINRPGLQASFLVAIREDALAKLDHFKRDIPKLFDTALRVSHLNAAAAREAILRPVDHYNSLVDTESRVMLEPALVDKVLDQVKAGQVVLDQVGHGALQHTGDATRADDHIETPYLQLVLTRLWETERQIGSRELRLATLTQLGGAQEIVRTHLDAALANLTPTERDAAADLFHHLVTPSGSKIAHMVADLAEYTRHPEDDVERLLRRLASADTRIVRPVPPPGEDSPARFEIYHDVLAASVLDWRTRHNVARAAAEELRAHRAARRRRLLRLAGAAAILAAILLVLMVNARRNAQTDRQASALSRFSAFDVNPAYRYTSSYAGSRITSLKVTAPSGTRISVFCTRRQCRPFARTIRDTHGQAMSVTTLRHRRLILGAQIQLFATGPHGIAKYYAYSVSRGGNLELTARTKGCLPPDTHLPAKLLRASAKSGCLKMSE
jgi:hypothetical protein